jgi:hypothetical protein
MSTISTATEQHRPSSGRYSSTGSALHHRSLRYHTSAGGNGLTGNGNGKNFLFLLLQRAIHFPQLDVEYAQATIAELIWSPSKVYKLAQSRHEIKGHWSRDDPCFVLFLCWFIIIDFLAYGFALDVEYGIGRIFRHIFMGLFFFFALGSIVGTCTWFLCNKYFQTRHAHSAGSQKVEWFYAFDVHCNAFLPAFLLLGVAQYLLLPLLVRGGILPALLSNTLHLAASLAYVHITVLGFLSLPFLNREKVTMMWNPAFLLVLLWFVLSLMNINCTRFFFFRVF